jgi:hypothetical protein
MKSKSQNRSFGVVFSFIFLLIALWPILNENQIRVWSLMLSIILLILGLLNSKILTPLKTLWIKFGEKLGVVIAPIVMGIIYFFVITPTSFLMKIFGKDLLNTKFSKEKTYWIKRNKPTGTMKKQF